MLWEQLRLKLFVCPVSADGLRDGGLFCSRVGGAQMIIIATNGVASGWAGKEGID